MKPAGTALRKPYKFRFTCPTPYTFVATMSVPCMQRKQFMQQKEQCLSGVDLSRKGSVDAPILDLVNFINAQPDFFTTSSCSGRTIVVDNTDKKGDVQKQGCQWLYVTHEEACFNSVQTSLARVKDAAVFKFEPLVMHIQVRSLELARHLHATAVASGFRNSGITVGGKGKIIVAVRSTHSLEVPLSCSGQLLVTDSYIEHLVHCANKKLRENNTRICRFFQNFKAMVEKPLDSGTHSKEKQAKRTHHQHPPATPAHGEDQVGEHTADQVDEHTAEQADEHTGRGLPSDQSLLKDDDGIEECFDSLLFEET